MNKIITRNFEVPDMHRLAAAKRYGAYASFEKLSHMTPGEVTGEVLKAGLRGRGGAGFPTGEKWGAVSGSGGRPIYLIVNADEGEPGTFKDRAILEHDPHLLIEGIVIAAYAIGAAAVFVYFRGEFVRPHQLFIAALEEASGAGLFSGRKGGPDFVCNITVHRGAGAYICGEETALISSIEGVRGLPRIKPPYPVTKGLFGHPTVVNNVETIASLPFIIMNGADEYRKMGTRESPGTKLVSVCGHVERPGVYEIELGMPLATFLAGCAGGTLEGRALKAVLPGGVSAPVLTASEALGARLDFESMEAAGSKLGAGGLIVLSDTACCVRVLGDIAKFFAHESCGQCGPCREGSGWVRNIVGSIENGDGRADDLKLLLDLARGLHGRTMCPLGAAIAAPLKSFVTKFEGEVGEHIRLGMCPFEHD